MTTVFLHGLESSSRGTKGSWFRQHFPKMLVPDFTGSLRDRMDQLNRVLTGRKELLLVGSSFGGLMAAILAIENPERVSRLILLAPALNFPEFDKWHGRSTPVETLLYIGGNDDVCPPAVVIPAAKAAFPALTIHQTDDDHLLRATFAEIDWQCLLGQRG